MKIFVLLVCGYIGYDGESEGGNFQSLNKEKIKLKMGLEKHYRAMLSKHRREE